MPSENQPFKIGTRLVFEPQLYALGTCVTKKLTPCPFFLTSFMNVPMLFQIGLMDGNTFCTTLSPRLFTINLAIMEHKVFFTELLSLCEADDQTLQKLPCYKAITNLVPLRKSALRALSACHYIPECREKIFTVLFKSLNSTNNDLVEASYECMKKFISGNYFWSKFWTPRNPDSSEYRTFRIWI